MGLLADLSELVGILQSRALDAIGCLREQRDHKLWSVGGYRLGVDLFPDAETDLLEICL